MIAAGLLDPKKGATVNVTQSKKSKHDLLLAQGKIAPCIGCDEVCNPEYCSLLDEWLELLM